jgi:alpha-tubulin suppressor-like RCC1 family protein
MSLRQQNAGSIIKPGFNPLAQGTPIYAYELYAWGQNANGQLGLNNLTNYSSPKQVGTLTNWSVISSGAGSDMAAVKTDGTLWTCGYNFYGQLGIGTSGSGTDRSSPVQVGSDTNWATVSASGYSAGAIKTDGTLWMWGIGNNGALGLGNTTTYNSPKQVGILTNWLKINCGSYTSTFAMKTDGSLWAWGQNSNGQLGLGDTTNRSSPVQVGLLVDWASIAPDDSYIIAIKTDGTLWAWGANSQGQLGLGDSGTYTKRSSPTQVGSLNNWSKISTSFSGHAIKTDGTMWSWGYNADGRLGLNNLTSYSSPKQVGALTTWSQIENTLAIKTNGTLWSWGPNAQGQLGIGTTTQTSSPAQVGASTTWNKVACRSTSVWALG